jgi:hypothetical protein
MAQAVREAIDGALQSRAPSAQRPAQTQNREVSNRPASGRGSSLDTETVLREVAREAGRGVEAIAKSLRVKTKQLQLPLKKLVESRKIKTTGQRRGMRYTAAGQTFPLANGTNTAKASSPAQTASGKRPSRGRGSSVEVDAVLAEVKRQGGRSSEAIAKSLRVAPRQLRSALVKLVESKKIKTKGIKRGMRYSAA